MSTINGGPAFPLTEDAVNFQNRDLPMQGMFLRDFFASKVEIPKGFDPLIAETMMGEAPPRWSLAGDYENNLKCIKWWATAEARYRYMRADAMIVERERKGATQ